VVRPFPDTPIFTGFDWLVRADAEVFDLEIVGKVSEDLNGTFYRWGLEYQYPPMREAVFVNGEMRNAAR
jgi:hypothetical protein